MKPFGNFLPNQDSILEWIAAITATLQDVKDAGVGNPIASPFHLPVWSVQRQMVLGEWLWITVNPVRWWVQLQLLLQTCYLCLSRSMTPPPPPMQLLTWQMLHFFLDQFARTIRSSLLLSLRANSPYSKSCLWSVPALLLFATISSSEIFFHCTKYHSGPLGQK